ncbi:M48 family metalloprotease [Sphingomonas sp. NBWT7]|uniref:M48 family metalloprotease n=1 Tax=Sphingomonas sp. NBWT7 TaxID=2596913 RepID=UPI001626E0E5|nr:M48 family metalloprotease [Sphingomonas sp. NBWT7]QNE31079.1 M48 family metalloprotease [Sphingomonas sp. NBWT7]
MAIDVRSATEAYLHLIPLARELAATAYTREAHWLLLCSKLVALAIAALLARIDLAAMLAASLRSRAKPNRSAFAISFVILFSYFALEMPWFAVADWHRERSYGFSHQPLAAWAAEYAIQSLVTALVGAPLLAGFYAAARRTGPRWWVWGTGLAALGLVLALVVQPVALAPILHRYAPAPAGEMRTAVERLVASGGVGGVGGDRILVYDGSRQSSRYTASVTGIGSSATVLLSDAMFAQGADVGAVRAVVAHELGHQRHAHPLQLAIFLTFVVGVGLLVAQRSFKSSARLLGRSELSLADPAGLPILLGIFAVYTLVTTPLVNTAERLVEADADRYGLELAREPDGMARAVLATADYRASRPTRLEEFLFYDHPSNARRIEAAMEWKADHAASAASALRCADCRSGNAARPSADLAGAEKCNAASDGIHEGI